MNAMIEVTPPILSAQGGSADLTPGSALAKGSALATGSEGHETATTGAVGEAVSEISGLRERIDEIDNTLIELWRERAAISAEVGRVRIASGGTRLVLSREREIVDRFRDALGADGVQVALLILRAGRGPL
jgi:chorismate mutase